MDTPTEAHREVWERVARDAGLAREAARLFPYAEPCFVVGSLARGAGPLGASRLGGAPDLPATLAWPTREGTHLTFLAQLDLSALTPGWVAGLPSSGWLYFFLGVDQPASDVTHAVLYFDGPREALSPAAPPSGTRAIDRFSPRDLPACALRLEPSLVVDGAAEEALELEEFALEFLEASQTALGGLPVSWGHDPRQDAYVLRTGFASLLHRTHLEPQDLEKQTREAWTAADDERAEELERATEQLRVFRAEEPVHRAEMKRWRVLFVLGSEREAGMCWWDAGALQFLVRADDLSERRFDRTYCCVTSS
jgi:uncharacterized protein YwqG